MNLIANEYPDRDLKKLNVMYMFGIMNNIIGSIKVVLFLILYFLLSVDKVDMSTPSYSSNLSLVSIPPA